MPQPSRVALLDLLRTVELPPAIAAAMIAQIAARLDRWVSARRASRVTVPRLEDLAIERGGRVYWRRGRSVPAGDGVRTLGCLLDALLSYAAHRQSAAPLVYIVSRATDPRHLAPLATIRDFAAAIARHAPARPAAAIDAIVARYLADACGAPPLGARSTIADIRRRRRAGGTPLQAIARDTEIPVSLLRELEWGVYENWPLPLAAANIAAYAARAGLDPDTVLAIVDRDQRALSPRVAGPAVRARAALVLVPAPFRQPRSALPFGLAVLAATFVLLAAPADPPAATPAAIPGTAPIYAPIAIEPAAVGEMPRDSPGVIAPSEEDAAPRAPRSIERPHPRLVSEPPPPAPDPATRPAAAIAGESEEARHTAGAGALVRLARALAGDGRYKAEPFPKPAGENPH